MLSKIRALRVWTSQNQFRTSLLRSPSHSKGSRSLPTRQGPNLARVTLHCTLTWRLRTHYRASRK